MKYILRSATAMVLGLLVWSSCGDETPTKIAFAPSLEEALQLAAERNQPVVADFWRDG